jgi:nitrite reductase/ring-hydroxylating ferredoxin subunit
MYPTRPVRVVRSSELAEGQRVLKVHCTGLAQGSRHALVTSMYLVPVGCAVLGACASLAPRTKRACALQEVLGRSVTLLRHGEKVYCVDTLCSHMGGPLGQSGDIEDTPDGSACIRCPWHSFRVCGGVAVRHPHYADTSR